MSNEISQSAETKVTRRVEQSKAVNVHEYERLASNIGGGILAAYGLYRMDLIGLGLAALGGSLLYRGTTGHCHAYDALGINTADDDSGKSLTEKGGTRIEKQITVNRPPKEIFAFWRNFENLPRIMSHLESVTVLDEKRSRWTANAPLGTTVEWDAEINGEIKNRRIGWRSLKGADVENAGSVTFAGTNNGRSTNVIVALEFVPPAGAVGAAVASLFGENPDQQLDEDLRKFKQAMEADEFALTTDAKASAKINASPILTAGGGI